ncbi:hypothetical protein AVEN_208094-1 [Araneus ventricosus]|uniref:Uncharacterized protein n=1 Tax=Araneus ventricosus TaxID=182803 RepID=A0A4Y2FZ43_ARAVE|nr:hypothetical protein AVEN_208094-1 [Araneus ventricosus]
MGRWNSKGCQTLVKCFQVRRQKEEVSLAAGPRGQRHRRSQKKIDERRYREKLFKNSTYCNGSHDTTSGKVLQIFTDHGP